MIFDYDRIQNEIRALGTVRDNDKFLEGFLAAFDFPKATFARIMADCRSGGVYVLRKIFYIATPGNLYSELNILKRNDLRRINTDYVLIANATDVLAYESESGDVLETSKAELYKFIEFFFPLLGRKRTVEAIVESADIKAAEKFAQLYNQLVIKNPTVPKTAVNELIRRLLLCCFTDSIGMLTKGGLRLLIENYTDAETINGFFVNLFEAIHTPDRASIPGYFSDVNVIDTRLFQNPLPKFTFDRAMRRIVLDLLNLDWSEINPEVLGALIQSIIRPDDPNFVGNFTSTANIQKVIGPLFMDRLYHRFEEVKGDPNECRKLLQQISQICVFDPACRTGGFLLEAYGELTKLANLVLDNIGSSPTNIVSISNFYGLDDDSFTCAIARLGFFFVLCQDARKNGTLATAFPNAINQLFTHNIVCGNAIRIDWDSICTGTTETYIIGNPPYHGSKKQTPEQKADLARVFAEYKNCTELDFAACYFFLATKFITAHGGEYAFVTTNSLTQGSQVSLLWPKLFEKGVHIRFAHTSFKWKNDACNRTTVTVVIIGIALDSNRLPRELFTLTTVIEVPSISPYLVPGNTIVTKKTNPISKLPQMVKGNMPLYWSDYLLSHEEMTNLVGRDPRARKFLKRVVGGDEVINGIERWCFWIQDSEIDEAMSIPDIAERVEAVRKARLASPDQSARKHASHSHQFREMRVTHTNSLVVPEVSSENRAYLQIDFFSRKFIIASTNYVIYDCEPWVFGVIASKMHNLWIKTVCGALETRPRYAPRIGYHTFPFPDITEEQKEEITRCVQGVLAARERYPHLNLAQMYDNGEMPPELAYAHALLDAVIDRCYKDTSFVSDQERLDCLFELYEKLEG